MEKKTKKHRPHHHPPASPLVTHFDHCPHWSQWPQPCLSAHCPPWWTEHASNVEHRCLDSGQSQKHSPLAHAMLSTQNAKLSAHPWIHKHNQLELVKAFKTFQMSNVLAIEILFLNLIYWWKRFYRPLRPFFSAPSLKQESACWPLELMEIECLVQRHLSTCCWGTGERERDIHMNTS